MMRFILGFVFVDQRAIKRDLHSAISGHKSGAVTELGAALRAHVARHGLRINTDLFVDAVLRYCIARNHERAHKLIDNGLSDIACRLWYTMLVRLVRKLFWPVVAVLIALAIYQFATQGTL